MLRGKEQIMCDKLVAGDIGALAKLQFTGTGNTLCDAAKPIRFDDIEFPAPSISMAVYAKKTGEEDKIFSGLARLQEEDPTITVGKDAGTGETLLSGQGEMHIEVISKKLAGKFGVEAQLQDPKIAYRETIRKSVDQEGRHKKQTGGHGQFADVKIIFEPIGDSTTEFEFVDKVVGGTVPRNFIPSVEKGLRENLPRGVLAGYPMFGLRATLYDGGYHPVDSSEMAFKTAARIAYKEGCKKANPGAARTHHACGSDDPRRVHGRHHWRHEPPPRPHHGHGARQRPAAGGSRSAAGGNVQIRHGPALHDAGARFLHDAL